MPMVIAHADWSVSPAKRMLAVGVRQGDGRYRLLSPQPAGPVHKLLRSLGSLAGRGNSVLVGFDFPIGLPIEYARRAGFNDFITALPQLGGAQWPEFYQVAEAPWQISLARPFYPARPGEARLRHLVEGLGLARQEDLRRKCERQQKSMRAAAPLFWTIGPQQVGKAAIHGWQTVLTPGLEDGALGLGLWPFHGRLWDLIQSHRTIVVESYPAAYYHQLGVSFTRAATGTKGGKRAQMGRKANSPALEAAAGAVGAQLDPDLAAALVEGFGHGASGEDAFDALVGLLALVWMVAGRMDVHEPDQDFIREMEGWIIGRQHFG